MTRYRCYVLNSQDQILSAENIEVERLDDAIDRALVLLDQRPPEHGIELWQGPLRVYASREQLRRHQCHVYAGAPSETLPTMAAIIGERLGDNLRCLYLNSPTMVVGLKVYLSAAGVDVERHLAAGALVLSSEQAHVAAGGFDAVAMLRMLETAIDQALGDGYRGLWATGDMTWEVGPHCDADQVLDYEWGLEAIFRRRPELSGICQYHAGTLPDHVVAAGVAAHRSIFVNDTLSRINPRYLAPFGARVPDLAVNRMIDEIVAGARPAE
jgi:hypothetical protein